MWQLQTFDHFLGVYEVRDSAEDRDDLRKLHGCRSWRIVDTDSDHALKPRARRGFNGVALSRTPPKRRWQWNHTPAIPDEVTT